MENDEFIGAVVLDPVTERASVLVALAAAIDSTKDVAARAILRKSMSKIFESLPVPPKADVVPLKSINGDRG